jgi:hypothetical protein
VAVHRVGLLEAIQVDQHEADGIAAAPAGRPRLERVDQRAPVCEAGQGIRERQPPRLFPQLDEPLLADDDEEAEQQIGGAEDQELRDQTLANRIPVIEERQRVHGDAREQVRDGLAAPVEVRAVADDEEQVEDRLRLGAARGGHRDGRDREAERAGEVRDERVGALPRDQEEAARRPCEADRGQAQHQPPVRLLDARNQHHRGSGDRAGHVQRASQLSAERPLLDHLEGAQAWRCVSPIREHAFSLPLDRSVARGLT